jgi:plastocyanin
MNPSQLPTRMLLSLAVVALLGTACSSSDGMDSAAAPTAPAMASTAPMAEPSEPSEPSEPATMPSAVAEPSPPAPADTGAEAVTITIADFDYAVPGPVAAGAEVKVLNKDREAHTVTLKGDSDVQLVVQGGETDTFTAPPAGTYTIVCDFHGNMTAELVVA